MPDPRGLNPNPLNILGSQLPQNGRLISTDQLISHISEARIKPEVSHTRVAKCHISPKRESVLGKWADIGFKL